MDALRINKVNLFITAEIRFVLWLLILHLFLPAVAKIHLFGNLLFHPKYVYIHVYV